MIEIKNQKLKQMIYSDFNKERKRMIRQLKAENSSMSERMDIMSDKEGKLIRPMLFYLVYLIFSDGLSKDMSRIALGIEWIHSGSLIHDDIMDNGSVRRGRKTVISEYGLLKGAGAGGFHRTDSI